MIIGWAGLRDPLHASGLLSQHQAALQPAGGSGAQGIACHWVSLPTRACSKRGKGTNLQGFGGAGRDPTSVTGAVSSKHDPL